jgi:hypothetical protein
VFAVFYKLDMKIKRIVLISILFMGFVGFLAGPSVYADTCDGYSTSIIPCSKSCPDGVAPVGGKCSDGSAPNSIWGILLLAINILTGGVGIAAVAGVVYGSVLYASAGGSADQVKKAKGIILNVIIGLVAYALMYSFLNFIIPGGIF